MKRDVPPAVRVLHSSVAMFLMAIAPQSLEFAVMWGLIYLTTTASFFDGPFLFHVVLNRCESFHSDPNLCGWILSRDLRGYGVVLSY